MNYKFYLPNGANQPVEYITQSNSVILIGANGSGKSKLGEWMEKNDEATTHRIGAQRSLVFGRFIQQKSYEQAANLLVYGNENKRDNHFQRWGHDGEKYNYTSLLLNDYENVLSALIALKNKEQEEYLSECKTLEREGRAHEKVPLMVTDRLKCIWKSVFPQRSIKFDDAKVTAEYTYNGEKKEYKGRDMSDGERVALYLIAQALCVPENKTIIVDEPELHIHRSIMNRLWTTIEMQRKDCLFVYITHDTQFAANHSQAKKIWVKSYNGENWDLAEIDESNLPEDLLLNILGNRRPVLFVEGTSNSYDTKLYSELYKGYYVVPCGGCARVITQTKAMRSNPQLHHLKCYGLIDRDFRSDNELNRLQDDGIYTIKVAEVENLFLVEELLGVVNSIMGFSDDSRIVRVKNCIINERLRPQLSHQISEAIITEIKFRLATAGIIGKNVNEVEQSLTDLFNGITFNEIVECKKSIFENVLDLGDYGKILEIFNYKTLSKSIGHHFDLKDNEYCDFIIRQLSSTRAEEIRAAIIGYLPFEIVR